MEAPSPSGALCSLSVTHMPCSAGLPLEPAAARGRGLKQRSASVYLAMGPSEQSAVACSPPPMGGCGWG